MALNCVFMANRREIIPINRFNFKHSILFYVILSYRALPDIMAVLIPVKISES